jgi:hypothetical protein
LILRRELLANVYLHYAFDLWAEAGAVIIVRYVDDLVIGFEHEDDARRFWEAMRERLREFSLAPGEDPPDRVRLLCGGPTRSARARRSLPHLCERAGIG